MLELPSDRPRLAEVLSHRPVAVVGHGQHERLELLDVRVAVCDGLRVAPRGDDLGHEQLVTAQVDRLLEAALKAERALGDHRRVIEVAAPHRESSGLVDATVRRLDPAPIRHSDEPASGDADAELPVHANALVGRMRLVHAGSDPRRVELDAVDPRDRHEVRARIEIHAHEDHRHRIDEPLRAEFDLAVHLRLPLSRVVLRGNIPVSEIGRAQREETLAGPRRMPRANDYHGPCTPIRALAE